MLLQLRKKVYLWSHEKKLRFGNMSPASRSKSKDKKAIKEPSKVISSKPLSHINTNSGSPTNGYNPLLGTFHTVEAAPVTSPTSLDSNGRLRNIDDTDEYASVSNNGSWSGESEDNKEKTSHPASRPDTVPGADNDKREKLRQKNEKKHQRQKERRAQELHERCSGYLMSRKLELLSQQLVAMGFSQERATMALIMNEGKVEESVAWLFEVAENSLEQNVASEGNLKIDISEELARIADMEIRYTVSKQEIERVVVACEGDLRKAEETLKEQKQEPPKIEEIGDPPKPVVAAISQNSIIIQAKPTVSQQKPDKRDLNYNRVPVTVVGSSSKKPAPKLDWANPQQIPVGSSNPSVSYSSVPPPLKAFSMPPIKTEARFNSVTNELKNLQLGSVREPIILIQRPQSINMKQAPSSSTSSPPGTGWVPNNIETMRPSRFVLPVNASKSFGPKDLCSDAMYNHQLYQSQQFVPTSGSTGSGGNGLWSRGGASPPLAASSLGFFSGLGPGGSSGSSVDWSMGKSMVQFDYANIDWSLDVSSLKQSNGRSYDSFVNGLGLKPEVPMSAQGNGHNMPGLGNEPEGGLWEWTSPFEERDLFSLPRQFVTSPTL